MQEKTVKKGLVIGKFLPFHQGHKALIEFAFSQSDEVHIIIVNSHWHSCDVKTRMEWIHDSFPKAFLYELNQDDFQLKDEDPVNWAKATYQVLSFYPDLAFSSEDYDEWAKLLHAKHVLFDKKRVQVNISATKIRKDPLQNANFLDDKVRKWVLENEKGLFSSQMKKDNLQLKA